MNEKRPLSNSWPLPFGDNLLGLCQMVFDEQIWVLLKELGTNHQFCASFVAARMTSLTEFWIVCGVQFPGFENENVSKRAPNSVVQTSSGEFHLLPEMKTRWRLPVVGIGTENERRNERETGQYEWYESGCSCERLTRSKKVVPIRREFSAAEYTGSLSIQLLWNERPFAKAASP